MERREAFRRWLQNEPYKRTRRPIPEKLIDGYLRSIHRVSDVMYETGVISKRLYSMRDVEEVEIAIQSIKHDCTYLTMNNKSENMCHKALDYYMAFTKVQAAKRIDK